MNKFISAIKLLQADEIKSIVQQQPKWLDWQEADGKNALHYLCGIEITKRAGKETASLEILKYLLKKGMDINAVHQIKEKDCVFPATPLWYSYAKGRNKKLYTYLLKQGANPGNCMFAIAWNDDVEAAKLFSKYSATSGSEHFQAAYFWRRYEVANWFLQQGADINYIGEDGYSALMLAVKRKSGPEEINDLLAKGADPFKQNNEGVSAHALAIKSGQKKVATLLNKQIVPA